MAGEEWMNRDDAIALWRASSRYREQEARDKDMWERHWRGIRAREAAEREAERQFAKRSRKIVEGLSLGFAVVVVLIACLVL